MNKLKLFVLFFLYINNNFINKQAQYTYYNPCWSKAIILIIFTEFCICYTVGRASAETGAQILQIFESNADNNFEVDICPSVIAVIRKRLTKMPAAWKSGIHRLFVKKGESIQCYNRDLR